MINPPSSSNIFSPLFLSLSLSLCVALLLRVEKPLPWKSQLLLHIIYMIISPSPSHCLLRLFLSLKKSLQFLSLSLGEGSFFSPPPHWSLSHASAEARRRDQAAGATPSGPSTSDFLYPDVSAANEQGMCVTISRKGWRMTEGTSPT